MGRTYVLHTPTAPTPKKKSDDPEARRRAVRFERRRTGAEGERSRVNFLSNQGPAPPNPDDLKPTPPAISDPLPAAASSPSSTTTTATDSVAAASSAMTASSPKQAKGGKNGRGVPTKGGAFVKGVKVTKKGKHS
jgi:hypothetical protein